ncbi:hypothetical protein V9T40_013608 [Parthenolecanium corni]|uniref:Uncharacterized protein n=1 Tax=Parthenolecanium corni TaxID=536013 RepID=A0AAN9TBK7_9HEMI
MPAKCGELSRKNMTSPAHPVSNMRPDKLKGWRCVTVDAGSKLKKEAEHLNLVLGPVESKGQYRGGLL